MKEILHELDPKLTETELDGIIEEIDEDGSGTVDFDGKGQKGGKAHLAAKLQSSLCGNERLKDQLMESG